jgi:hypothetical protein
MEGGIPIGGPFLHIADHVVQSVAVWRNRKEKPSFALGCVSPGVMFRGTEAATAVVNPSHCHAPAKRRTVLSSRCDIADLTFVIVLDENNDIQNPEA